MRLFLDTSTLLSACGSEKGASREIFRFAAGKDWTLVATPYVIGEVVTNLHKLPPQATATWAELRESLVICEDVVTLDRPAVFGPGKDRPILFGALAWADVLLTLDRNDFGHLLGGRFYDLPVLKPGDFLQQQRAKGPC